MLWHKKYLLLVILLILSTNVSSKPQRITVTIGEGEDVRGASGYYDEEKGMLIINTRGSIKLGPLIPAKDEKPFIHPTKPATKEEVRKELRGDKL